MGRGFHQHVHLNGTNRVRNRGQTDYRNIRFCVLRFLAYSLFKGALHERAGVLSVDPVTSDGHQVPSAGHGVTQQGKMAIVHIGTVKRNDVVQLPLESLSHRLNTKYLWFE